MMALMEGGNSMMMSLMNSFKGTFEMSLDQNLPDLVKDNAGEMMQGMGMPVDMIVNMAKVFSTVDVGFSFNSTEQLPENVRSQLGNEMNMIGQMTKPRNGGWSDSDKEMF